MRQVASKVTRKGQVTVPADVRRLLNLKEGDRVNFVFDGSDVRLSRAGSVVERTAGVFKSKRKALSAEQMRQAAEEAIADEAEARAGR